MLPEQNSNVIDEMLSWINHIEDELFHFKSKLRQMEHQTVASPEELYQQQFGEALHPDLVGLIGELSFINPRLDQTQIT